MNLELRRVGIVCVSILIICQGCQDYGSNPVPFNFSAGSTSITLGKGTSSQVSLSGGLQPYSITVFPDNAVATASLVSSILTISAIDTGTTFITLQDSHLPTPQTIQISIVVGASSPAILFSSQIQPIFNNACVSCHGSNGGLSLSPGVSYANLVNVLAQSSCIGFHRVHPSDAANSVLYLKISGTSCGSRMPLGGSLSAPQIALIRDWINQGANNN